MNKLTQNITNIFGEKGKEWLANLPVISTALASYWKLNSLVPVDNMTFNYVAKAITDTNQPVILKISCDEKTITNEQQALLYFDGNGSIQLIESIKSAARGFRNFNNYRTSILFYCGRLSMYP